MANIGSASEKIEKELRGSGHIAEREAFRLQRALSDELLPQLSLDFERMPKDAEKVRHLSHSHSRLGGMLLDLLPGPSDMLFFGVGLGDAEAQRELSVQLCVRQKQLA